jgi:hypothetical protein
MRCIEAGKRLRKGRATLDTILATVQGFSSPADVRPASVPPLKPTCRTEPHATQGVSQDGLRLTMSSRQQRPATRRTSGTAHKASPNAQKNYERYLALARTEAQAGNPVGAENLPARRTLFQIDVFDPREAMAPAGGIKSNGASPWGSLEGRRPTPRVG